MSRAAVPVIVNDLPIRSSTMQLLSESLARAECSRRLSEAQSARERRRLIAAARNRRALDLALRRLERAELDVEKARALAGSSV